MDKRDIRVVIVEDSGLMRLILSDIVNSEVGMTVVGTASDGKEAVDVVLDTKPDVVLMDMIMDKYDGLYGVRNILKKVRVPIIILSAIGHTNLEPVLEALNLGAFDYINKPIENKAKIRLIDNKIIDKIRLAVKSNNKHFTTTNAQIKLNSNLHTFDNTNKYKVIVIGASTGGPTAVERVISKLPSNLPIPVLIAQHMPANFIPPFVKRINGLTPLDVKVGEKGEMLKSGTIYIAPGDSNMIIKTMPSGLPVIDFTNMTYTEFNNPSINALMLSVNEVFGKKSIGIILTGMGKDGANGMESIYKSGGYTIAQNKESSVVYGMPKEVAERGVINKAISIYEIGGFIVSCLS